MHKSEIENLVAAFRAELIADSLKYQGSKAVGAVGSFIAAVESHRARYAKRFSEIRVNADATINYLANETERTIDALAQQEIQRARDMGRVELNPELSPDQQPHQWQGKVELIIRESQRNVAPVESEIVAEESGTEKYIPPDRREQRSDIERIMFLEESQADPVAGNLNAAVQSVASMSSEEIDRVINAALEGLRSIMPNDGERVGDENNQSRKSEPRGNGDEAA